MEIEVLWVRLKKGCARDIPVLLNIAVCSQDYKIQEDLLEFKGKDIEKIFFLLFLITTNLIKKWKSNIKTLAIIRFFHSQNEKHVLILRKLSLNSCTIQVLKQMEYSGLIWKTTYWGRLKPIARDCSLKLKFLRMILLGNLRPFYYFINHVTTTTNVILFLICLWNMLVIFDLLLIFDIWLWFNIKVV